jgi:N-acylneuraminate cytidylyltransferase
MTNAKDVDQGVPSITALVPMKGHSERVPGKNLRAMCNKPLFYWILDALSRSKFIDRIVVNTDSPEIARLTTTLFDVTIIDRPADLQGDYFVANDLIAYDLTQFPDVEYFLQTHSTNPLLKTETIDRAIAAYFQQNKHDSLFSVTELHTRLYWAEGTPLNHDPSKLIRTQDLEPIYEENSCLYIFSRASFNKKKNRIGESPLMFPIDRFEAVDIDEEFDFLLAESLLFARFWKSE